MGEGRKLKTEHSGAKNGGGYWGHRADAKRDSSRRRRQNDHAEVRAFWDDESLQGSLTVKQRIVNPLTGGSNPSPAATA